MNKIIEDYKKIVAGNKAGKNICFMSRGEYADPKIAYKGILMNYWDVYDCMDEVEEPTDDDWHVSLFVRKIADAQYKEERYECLNGTGWIYCIPYEGNEHLL
jgi:hypothetical protein